MRYRDRQRGYLGHMSDYLKDLRRSLIDNLRDFYHNGLDSLLVPVVVYDAPIAVYMGRGSGRTVPKAQRRKDWIPKAGKSTNKIKGKGKSKRKRRVKRRKRRTRLRRLGIIK